MKNNIEKVNSFDLNGYADNPSNESNNKNELSDILRLSAKVFIRTVATITFIAMLFLFIFPYSAMRFYNGLGLKKRALSFAESYVERNELQYNEISPAYDSKFVDALLYCVNTSSALMNGAVNEFGVNSKQAYAYAEKTDGFIEAFTSFNLNKRIEIIDLYSIENTSASFKPYVYSFRDDIGAAQVRARIFTYAANNADADILEMFNKLKSPDTNDFTLNDLRESAAVMAYVSSYIKASILMENGTEMSLLYENGSITSFYTDFSEYLEKAKKFVLNEAKDIDDADIYLQMLYCFRRLAEVSESFNSLKDSAFAANSGFDVEFWSKLNTISVQSGEDKSLSEYFMLTLLYNYTRMF